MVVVSNATPLISLSSVGHFALLEQLFGEIVIPDAVYQEIKAKRSYAYDEVDADFVRVELIKGVAYRSLLLTDLDKGEAETILLAKELVATHVLIDERLGYQIGRAEGLNVVRTLSLLLKAKKEGMILELKPLLDEMIGKGRWYSQQVYIEVLKRAGEL